ncbi:hypothetical protein EST38_g5162 [Candolleomyces aberdarensis]|uniref:Uncharacterized protein n=1 Tax=Candolleomyces aberdarensis TaxID=2316362 RepID=A0A4Q2DMZ1_9AGAR|nr:hypothetical protein EST38_g5162 [Candolleomyces aberdarensis]
MSTSTLPPAERPGYISMDLYDCYESSELNVIYGEARRSIREAGNSPRHLHILYPGIVYRPQDDDSDSDSDSWPCSDGEDALTEHHYVSRPGLIDFVKSTRGWEVVEIDLHDYPGFVQDVFHCGRNQQPLRTWTRVRSLSLFSDWRNMPPEGEDSFDCGLLRMTQQSFPMLRVVNLDLKCCSLLSWTLPWAQLTELTLGMLADLFSWYLEVLGRCSALQTFRLTVGEIQRCDDGHGGGGRRVTVPRLRVFSIDARESYADLAKSFFDKIQLPELETLEIKDRQSSYSEYEGSDSFFESLRGCFRRSRCSVRDFSLNVRNLKLKKETICRLLKSVPLLRSLHLAVDVTDVTKKHIRSLRMPELAEVTVDSRRSEE